MSSLAVSQLPQPARVSYFSPHVGSSGHMADSFQIPPKASASRVQISKK
jgi:hypothetical protein